MLKISAEKTKFLIFSFIGVFNTLFDIVLYVVLLNTTHSILLANIISTSAALVGSYFLNSHLTFRNKQWSTASFLGFIGVTIFGLWVLQTIVIYFLTHALSVLPESTWHIFGGFEHNAKTIVPKLLATGITFIWNYVWYNKVIFKNTPQSKRNAVLLSEL